jgi:hypothetical protein
MQHPIKHLLLILAAAYPLFTEGALAQGVLDKSTVTEDTGRLSVKIKMDRAAIYFPDELYDATIEVTNPTSAPMLVSAPFAGTTSCFFLSARQGDKLVSLGGPDARCSQSWLPVIMLKPGEIRRLVLHSYWDGFWPELTGNGAAPFQPGTFVLSYSYGSPAAADFEVVSPKLEADTVARVKDLMYSDRADGQDPHPLPASVHVFAVRWQNQSYICVSQSDVTNLTPDPAVKAGEFNPTVGPYKRVATSQEPIASLSAKADAEENLTIEWRTSSDGHGQFYYPASYVVRDAHERARKLWLDELNKDK